MGLEDWAYQEMSEEISIPPSILSDVTEFSRLLYSRKKHSTPWKAGDKVESLNVRGKLVEIGSALYLGVPYNLEVYESNHNDGGADLVYRGITIQCKETRKAHAPIYLAVNTLEELSAWTLVLGRALESSVILYGWTWRNTFRKKLFEHDFGYGSRLCMDIVDLNPMQEFKVG